MTNDLITMTNYSGKLPLLGNPQYYTGPNVSDRQTAEKGVFNEQTVQTIENYSLLTWRDRVMWWTKRSLCGLGEIGCIKHSDLATRHNDHDGIKTTIITSDFLALHQHVGKLEFTMIVDENSFCEHYLKLTFINGKIKKISPQIIYKETRDSKSVLISYGFWMFEKTIQNANPVCYRLGKIVLYLAVEFYEFFYDWLDISIINEEKIGNMRAIYHLENPFRDVIFEQQGHKCAHDNCDIISKNHFLLHLSKKDRRRPNNLTNHQLLCRNHHDELVAERRSKKFQFIKKLIKFFLPSK